MLHTAFPVLLSWYVETFIAETNYKILFLHFAAYFLSTFQTTQPNRTAFS